MKLETLLTQNRSTIVKRWLDQILDTYPAETYKFLKKQKNQFANPVGYTLSEEIDHLYGELLQGVDSDRTTPILDGIIRIRAVQDFSPSQAVGFIFLLKGVIRERLKTEIRDNRLSYELTMFESGIDDLALLAFEVYMRCREKLYEIRAKKKKNQVYRLLK
ncbi:MAG: RsbRD N-terminal domain-containing protein, partial [Deltaproteobacteria bacterium]|nr:RsbRD N-terminal domain-containing protein [Deltaproteobacteria bacterium]